METKELKIILKRLYREYVKYHFKTILFCLILSILVAGSTSATAWLLDPAVKKIFVEKDQTLAWLIPIAIIFAFAAKGLSLYFARLNIIKVGQKISGEMQKKLAKSILFSDIQTLDSRHSGKYISNIMYDCGQIHQLVSTAVLNLMKDSFSVVFLVGLMFYQNWKLALFAMIMIPLAAGLAKNLGKKMGKATLQASQISGKLTSLLSDIFKASKMIRVYQKEDDEKKNSEEVITQLVNKNIRAATILIRATPIMEVLTGIMIAGFIFYSGKLINAGELEVNNFFSFLAAMMLAYQPVRSLATINMTIHQGSVSAKRIFTVIDKPIEIKNDYNLPKLKITDCNIEFKDVDFRYETTNEKAVKNINLKFDGGKITALVGQSGAGKSTIINLIPRFYDPQNIVIGGAAGALPPVIGWTIATGNISLEPLILFSIIFLWTPSHFWALSLYKSGDYKRAKIPMLPIISGTKTTKTNILVYSLIMSPAVLAPYFYNFASTFYLIVSSIMTSYYIYLCFKLYSSKIVKVSNKIARKIFIYSIFYLFFIFLILLIDNLLK